MSHDVLNFPLQRNMPGEIKREPIVVVIYKGRGNRLIPVFGVVEAGQDADLNNCLVG